MCAEVLRLLRHPDFAPLFGPKSRAEVALAGRIDGSNVVRQVDRLCFRDNEIWVVDYKSNRPPPAAALDVPQAYRRQLAEYRRLLQDLYPGRRVRTFLLWSYTPLLMELEPVEIVDQAPVLTAP
jgi:ATP-dependent helicase/nuclease subunit A